MVQPNDQWRTWDEGAAVEKADGGRQVEWSDSAPSNFLPLPWTHTVLLLQTLFGSDNMMLAPV